MRLWGPVSNHYVANPTAGHTDFFEAENWVLFEFNIIDRHLNETSLLTFYL